MNEDVVPVFIPEQAKQTRQNVHRSAQHARIARYEWADVMLLPVNPSVLRIARAVEHALADLGISCGYLWSTMPDEATKHWGDAAESMNWIRMMLPVSWYANTPVYTVQMFRGWRAMLRHNLRGKFGVFVTFIDGGWSPRLLSLACERQGIPTVLIQEGMTLQSTDAAIRRTPRLMVMDVVRRMRERVAPELFQALEHGMHTRYACVYGPLKAASLIACGKPQDDIFVTGNPLFDTVVPRRIDAYPRSRTILYAHEVLGHDLDAEARWWRALVQASRDIGAKLIFKMHPRSPFSESHICELLNLAPANTAVQFVSSGDIQDMIADAGVFVTACSTSTYRALVEGVPAVVLQGVPAPYRIDLPDYGAALAVCRPDALAQTLRAALDAPDVRLGLQPGVDRAIERHLYRVDGQASHRVARVLASLLPT